MDSKVVYWLDLSLYDLETADAMLNSERFLYVGFMAHQSIEKVLKACFVKRLAMTPPHSHSLTFLAKKAGLYDEMTDEQLDFMDMLEPLNIEARYPAHKEQMLRSLSKERCVDILNKTRDMQVWIKQKL